MCVRVCVCVQESVIISRRKGFTRLAMQSGRSLLPVYIFGNTSTFKQLPVSKFLRPLARSEDTDTHTHACRRTMPVVCVSWMRVFVQADAGGSESVLRPVRSPDSLSNAPPLRGRPGDLHTAVPTERKAHHRRGDLSFGRFQPVPLRACPPMFCWSGCGLCA